MDAITQVTTQVAAVTIAAAKPVSASKKQESSSNSSDQIKNKPVSMEVDSAFKKVESFLQQSQTGISYNIDRETGIIYFQIIDSGTKEVIRQIPSEELIAMAKQLKKLGVLMDKEY